MSDNEYELAPAPPMRQLFIDGESLLGLDVEDRVWSTFYDNKSGSVVWVPWLRYQRVEKAKQAES